MHSDVNERKNNPESKCANTSFDDSEVDPMTYILVVCTNSNLIALDLTLLFSVSNDIVKMHAYVK